MAREYLNLDIELESSESGYVAHAAGPYGEARSEFAFPFEAHELRSFHEMFGRRRVRRLESPELERTRMLGKRLFDVVFAGDMRTVLVNSVRGAKAERKGLRIRLNFDRADDLITLPWEYLYRSEGDDFLSLSNWTPIVRYLDAGDPLPATPLDGPLEVLVMISDPVEYRGTIDVEAEWSQLEHALDEPIREGLVTLTRLPNGQLESLQAAVRNSDFHVFHYIGHGEFNDQEQDGVLILEDARARAIHVTGRSLGDLLRDCLPLRLAVLNNCQGATTSEMDPYAGSAQSLIQKGLPAVVAMQFEISDTAATAFARGFYTSLADGFPVDAAVAEARKTINHGTTRFEFGAPVLYLAEKTGVIFDRGVSPELPERGGYKDLVEQAVEEAAEEAMGQIVDRVTDDDTSELADESADPVVEERVTEPSGVEDTVELVEPKVDGPLPEVDDRIADDTLIMEPKVEDTVVREPEIDDGGGGDEGGILDRRSGRAKIAVGSVAALTLIVVLILIFRPDGSTTTTVAGETTTLPPDETTTTTVDVATTPPPPPTLRGVLMPDGRAQASFSEESPEIDGSLAEWPDTFDHEASHLIYTHPLIETGSVTRMGSDAAASIRLLWNGDGLYVGAVVADDVLSQPNTGNQIWRGDAITLNISTAPPGGASSAPDEDDYQVTLSPGDPSADTGPESVIFYGNGSQFGDNKINVAEVAAQRRPAGGYVLEARIPWAAFEIEPSPGQRLVALVTVFDNDGESDGTRSLQAAIKANTPRAEFQEPQTWGELLLGEEFTPFELPPDTERIAFGANYGERAIRIIASGGEYAIRITNLPETANEPSWSPDCSMIAFTSDSADGRKHIFVMNADGENLEQLTSGEFEDFTPAWSPDGMHIAFGSDRDGNRDIYVMELDSGNLTNVTKSASADDRQPKWSPNSSQIVFSSNASGSRDIFVIDEGSSVPQQLTFDAAIDTEPAWSPEGDRIAFRSDRGGAANIWVLTLDGPEPMPLTEGEATDRQPAWYPDGSALVFMSNRTGDFEIFRMNADGSDPLQLTDHVGIDAAPDVCRRG